MPVVKCPKCPATLSVSAEGAGRLKHQADGSHTFVPATPPKRPADIKGKGRPRA